MLKIIKNRLDQGYRTSSYPKQPIALYERFRGRPEINRQGDPALVRQCAEACPQEAIDAASGALDLGRCTFCGLCEMLSQGKFVRFTQNFELGAATRADLITDGSYADLAAMPGSTSKALRRRVQLPPVCRRPATPARPIPTSSAPRFSTCPGSASTLSPHRAMPTASMSPGRSPAT